MEKLEQLQSQMRNMKETLDTLTEIKDEGQL